MYLWFLIFNRSTLCYEFAYKLLTYYHIIFITPHMYTKQHKYVGNIDRVQLIAIALIAIIKQCKMRIFSPRMNEQFYFFFN